MNIYSGTHKDLSNTKPEPNSIAIIIHHPEDNFLHDISIPEGFVSTRMYQMGHNSDYEGAARQIIEDFLKQFPYIENVYVFDPCNQNRAPAVRIGLEYIIGQKNKAKKHEGKYIDHLPHVVREIRDQAKYFNLN